MLLMFESKLVFVAFSPTDVLFYSSYKILS